MPSRRPLALALRALAIVGVGLAVVGSFGPWVRSGRRQRSSYELLAVADRLGFLGSGAGRLLPRTWVLVPLAAACALAAVMTGRPRMGGTVAAGVGVYALVLSAGVARTPLPTGWGPTVAGVGGALALVAGGALVVQRQVTEEGRPS